MIPSFHDRLLEQYQQMLRDAYTSEVLIQDSQFLTCTELRDRIQNFDWTGCLKSKSK